MKRFAYAVDPLCLIACGLYVLNRFWMREHVGGAFLQGYFNDIFFIPAALPFVLWLQRRLNLRPDDQPPRWSEITMHLVVWSIAAEAIAPHFFPHAVGDWRDVVAYTAGAGVAGCWWQGLPFA